MLTIDSLFSNNHSPLSIIFCNNYQLQSILEGGKNTILKFKPIIVMDNDENDNILIEQGYLKLYIDTFVVYVVYENQDLNI
jgi:hypothetical protein